MAAAPGHPGARWVTCPVPRPAARWRLFCLPFGGAGASVFRPWAVHMPGHVEVLPIQPPGRETRLDEPPLTNLGEQAERLADALQPWLDRPFALFGHSLGGLVAFEVTRSLRRRGGPLPARLFLSACAPGDIRPELIPPMSHLPDEALLRELARLYATPLALSMAEPSPARDQALATLRADVRMVEGYEHVPEPPLHVPLSAFGGQEDQLPLPEEVGRWREQTTADFRLRVFPGGHFFLFAAREVLCEAILEDLDGRG